MNTDIFEVPSEETASRWEILAYLRHITDLRKAEEDENYPYYYDEDAADHVVEFFGYLRHSKGEWAGEPFHLAPWQEWMVRVLFGWKRKADGTRRFRIAYVEIPRKNGKSTLAAGIGLYLLVADGEPGAEVYSAATKMEQAKIVHGEALRMVKASPDLSSICTVYRNSVSITESASKYEPLSGDAKGLDGLNIHGAIVDELHAHKDRMLWDVILTARGSRREPLIFVITTAGYDKNTICYEQHRKAKQVLEGDLIDDTYFAYIATLDEEDDWQDPNVWAKANPNIGISVKLDNLEEECRDAIQMPSAQNSFMRLRLNVWTEQETRWMNTDAWRKCAAKFEREDLYGRDCYLGLDLSTTTDITAGVLSFPYYKEKGDELEMELEKVRSIPFFWIPEENAHARSKRDKVQYTRWMREPHQHLYTTPGNVIDYDFIRKFIVALGEAYNIKEVLIDRWQAVQLFTQLTGDGFKAVPFGQGFKSMSGPTKLLQRLILSGMLEHEDNEVLNWMISNIATKEDSAGNVKFCKESSPERIDGGVALVMSIGGIAVAEPPKVSVYKTRGIRTL